MLLVLDFHFRLKTNRPVSVLGQIVSLPLDGGFALKGSRFRKTKAIMYLDVSSAFISYLCAMTHFSIRSQAGSFRCTHVPSQFLSPTRSVNSSQIAVGKT